MKNRMLFLKKLAWGGVIVLLLASCGRNRNCPAKQSLDPEVLASAKVKLQEYMAQFPNWGDTIDVKEKEYFAKHQKDWEAYGEKFAAQRRYKTDLYYKQSEDLDKFIKSLAKKYLLSEEQIREIAYGNVDNMDVPLEVRKEREIIKKEVHNFEERQNSIYNAVKEKNAADPVIIRGQQIKEEWEKEKDRYQDSLRSVDDKCYGWLNSLNLSEDVKRHLGREIDWRQRGGY